MLMVLFIGGLVGRLVGLAGKAVGKLLKKKPPAAPPLPPRLPPRAPPPAPRLPAPLPVPRVPTRGRLPLPIPIPLPRPGGPRGGAVTQAQAITQETDRLGRPLMVQPEATQRLMCPPGYVVVTMPDGARACALKGVARAAGLWRPRPKPPIKASEWRKLRTAARVEKKAKKIAQTAGFTCRARGSRR